jgi:hypothetical protein
VFGNKGARQLGPHIKILFLEEGVDRIVARARRYLPAGLRNGSAYDLIPAITEAPFHLLREGHKINQLVSPRGRGKRLDREIGFIAIAE